MRQVDYMVITFTFLMVGWAQVTWHQSTTMTFTDLSSWKELMKPMAPRHKSWDQPLQIIQFLNGPVARLKTWKNYRFLWVLPTRLGTLYLVKAWPEVKIPFGTCTCSGPCVRYPAGTLYVFTCLPLISAHHIPEMQPCGMMCSLLKAY